MINAVARYSIPAENIDSLVKKEYYSGAMAQVLRLQQAPDQVIGVIEDELDDRKRENASTEGEE